jgi:hypothetical protein
VQTIMKTAGAKAGFHQFDPRTISSDLMRRSVAAQAMLYRLLQLGALRRQTRRPTPSWNRPSGRHMSTKKSSMKLTQFFIALDT